MPDFWGVPLTFCSASLDIDMLIDDHSKMRLSLKLGFGVE
jgi:hypothetical protein